MATEYQTITSTTEPSAVVQPYLSYGLGEAQRLYQSGGVPAITPSTATQQGLQALQNRALIGSPLTGAAQQQALSTIGGNYLSGNPFFQGAFTPAAQAATSAFNQAIGNVTSQASKAGRYGSGSMNTLQNQAANTLAQNLANTAGQLAYQNYAQERGLQQQAMGMAPNLAASDYADISQLLQAGQLGEGYTQAALAQPQQNLANYLTAIGHVPMGQSQSQTSPYYTNPTANALGTGLLGVSALTGLNTLTNGGVADSLSSGWDWLSGLWS